MNQDLKQIKNKYGEKMMHMCRSFFSTLLEQEGLLFKLMSENFNYSKELYEDIVNNKLEEEFKNYIYSFVDVEKKEIKIVKTPEELLKEAGYKLYECHTEEEIQSFKEYYKKGEELCTFNGNRLNRCHVFFAVKNNVEEVKREDFLEPKREDEYGTSVISIQFSRGSTNTLSIKNRYNHTVNNPDATFSNNLDNIIPGLTKSFEKQYNLNINSNKKGFEIPGYVKANDGKYYKYNYEINNIYYCPNNIIIDNFEVKKYDKEKYIILDYFILDLQHKKINLYDKHDADSFIAGLNNIEKIKIKVDKESKDKHIIINNDIIIKLDKNNNIIEYKNNEINKIEYYFLYHNKKLKKIELQSVEEIGTAFLYNNKELEKIELPKVKRIQNSFLHSNEKLKNIDLPKVEEIGSSFLQWNRKLENLKLLNVKEIGSNFLYSNKKLQRMELPQVEKIGPCFLHCNEELQSIELPQVKEIEECFLYYNRKLQSLYLPKVKIIGNDFLTNNEELQKIDLPQVEIIGPCFLHENQKLKTIELPTLLSNYYYNLSLYCQVLMKNNNKKGKLNELKSLYSPLHQKVYKKIKTFKEI